MSNKLKDSLHEIEDNLIAFSTLGLSELTSILKDLTEKSYYRTVVPLWIVYYKVAKCSDPKTAEEFIELYKEEDSIDHRLPTKSLSILKKAHSVLGEEKCCMKNEVSFVRRISKHIKS